MISVPTVACRVTGRFIYRSEIRRVSADGAVRIVPTGDPRTPEIGEVLQDVPIDGNRPATTVLSQGGLISSMGVSSSMAFLTA